MATSPQRRQAITRMPWKISSFFEIFLSNVCFAFQITCRRTRTPKARSAGAKPLGIGGLVSICWYTTHFVPPNTVCVTDCTFAAPTLHGPKCAIYSILALALSVRPMTSATNEGVLSYIFLAVCFPPPFSPVFGKRENWAISSSCEWEWESHLYVQGQRATYLVCHLSKTGYENASKALKHKSFSRVARQRNAFSAMNVCPPPLRWWKLSLRYANCWKMLLSLWRMNKAEQEGRYEQDLIRLLELRVQS